MLWSLLKIIFFVAIAAAVAYGASILLETPGEVRLALGNREFFLSPIGFTIALGLLLLAAIVLIKVIGFLVALVRFVLGDETAISRYFRGNRERRGFEALTDGMLALAAGDAKVAQRKAAKAEKLLQRPEITRLLAAQAAESAGDRRTALDAYKSMIPDSRTRFAGVQGALKLKLEAGEEDLALALADKAFAMRPDNSAVLRTRFDLQSKRENWAGARETLNASMHARLLPRDVGTRRDAVLSLADARKALEAGDTARGYEAARQANKLAPTLVPAAALAARAYLADGAKRKATKILTTAWSAGPHPDLAAAFAEIEPDESPSERRKRFGTLIAAAPDHAESKLLATELALADEDFPGARKALGDLAEREPTTRSLALMAAIERGLGSSEAVVRGFLAKALGASRGPQWICGKCNHVHGNWVPVCENCGAFDTLDWKAAPGVEDPGLASSSMLPLIIGQLDGGRADAAPEPTGRSDVEDAEIADRPA
jgi:HemY protein